MTEQEKIQHEIKQIKDDVNVSHVEESEEEGGVYLELFVYESYLPQLIELLKGQMDD